MSKGKKPRKCALIQVGDLLSAPVKSSLELFISTTSVVPLRELNEYLKKFIDTTRCHFKTEVEIQLKTQQVTEQSKETLDILEDDYKLMQYETMIAKILGPWVMQICGQPLYKNVLFYVQEIQNDVFKDRRNDDNKLCTEKSEAGPTIHNFTNYTIPDDIKKILSSWLSIVPHLRPDPEETKKRIEHDLKKSAINYFRSTMKYYPCGASLTMKFDELMLLLSSRVPCGSPLAEYFYQLRDLYTESIGTFITKIKNISCNDEMLDRRILRQIPEDVIVSISDKNLGVCLLPLSWYVKQYSVQCVKGAFQKIEMSEEMCIAYMINEINIFRNVMTSEQQKIVKTVWPKFPPPTPRVGVLKLVPKVHKLKIIAPEYWVDLSSRPIRGGEQCPMNHPSLALCSLLQQMIKDVRAVFNEFIIENSYLSFPVLSGCDLFSKLLQGVELEESQFSTIMLVSADFSDAYTAAKKSRLMESIKVLGQILKYSEELIRLMIMLVDLVFSNIYFHTPFGLYLQTQGYPMGK